MIDILVFAVVVGILSLISRSALVTAASLSALLVGMLFWRIRRKRTGPEDETIAVPYTCGFAAANGKELYVVATCHIAPRAAEDVRTVIDVVRPDVVMIELDAERLDDMSGSSHRQLEDLQAVKVTRTGHEPTTMLAQRAIWNGEYAGQRISGQVVFDEGNQNSLGPVWPDMQNKLLVIYRSTAPQLFSPVALKAHLAAQAGASALLLINSRDELPRSRIGICSLTSDLRVAMRTRSCGYPPIPVLLLPRASEEQLLTAALVCEASHVEFLVRPDDYPRRTLRRRICQATAVTLSGFGVLYGVMECFMVDAGDEFVVAYDESRRLGIPCECIDVDFNRLCSRLGAALLPSPCNVFHALSAWMALPRVVLHVIFPPPENVDVVGATVLHARSFRFRTWLALLVAGACASAIILCCLLVFGRSAEGAAEDAGIVKPQDRYDVLSYMLLAMELFALPRLYDAVARSRDEAMYRAILAKTRGTAHRRLVIVVGAAHANGILQRVRTRGL